MKSLFISKSYAELKLLPDFCAANSIQLVAQSLIRFEALPFTVTKPFEALFFSSPRSILFFLKGMCIPKGTFIACVGAGTAAVLRSLGYDPDFVGEGKDFKKIASDLQQKLGDKTILFPLSTRSLRSISSHLNPHQLEEVVVYETINQSHAIPLSDIVVFTSPSNVDSYLESNELNSGNTLIAWGESTAKALEKRQKKALVLDEPNEQALIALLKTLI